MKTKGVYCMKHGVLKNPLWSSCSQRSFFLDCRCSKQKLKKPLEIMTAEMDILPITRAKCCDTVNCLHWLSFPNWLLQNLWQLHHKKMWSSVFKCCGQGRRLFYYILLLVSSAVLFLPSSILIVFLEKYVRFTSGTECNRRNYLEPGWEWYFLS